MPIAMESGRGHGGGGGGGGGNLFGRRGATLCPAASGGWGGDSREAIVRCEEDAAGEESDGEVQSPYRGNRPLDTMDALQHALPRTRSSSDRRGENKVYNINSSSLVSAENVVVPSQHTKDPVIPEDPSPKKRKAFFPYSFDQDRKELNPVDDALCIVITDIGLANNKGYDEHKCCNNLLNTIDDCFCTYCTST
uniref:Uncharacterized protein n=1 Tax=Leersia perrieri TaxID=77586 RepID=A0A0D9WN16_9ORYZ